MGTISVTLPQAQFDVPVTVIVSGGAATLHLSQTGFRFQSISGGANPFAQNLTILSPGTGSLKYSASASTTSGEPWLSVSPGSGTISSSGARLGQGAHPIQRAGARRYYGQNRDFPRTTHPIRPQIASVVLNVASAGVDLGAFVYPTGLVFRGPGKRCGSAAPDHRGHETLPRSTLTFSSASFLDRAPLVHRTAFQRRGKRRQPDPNYGAAHSHRRAGECLLRRNRTEFRREPNPPPATSKC